MHRITVWGINYYPELVGIGVYNTDLCNFLSLSGYDVTMVTGFAYYPTWKQRAADQLIPYRLDIRSNNVPIPIKVQRCWLYVPQNPTVLKRILHEASFVLTSFFKLLILPRSDIYFVVMPPLLLGVFAWLLRLLRNVPVYLHVQDLQPDAALSLGMLKPGILANILLTLEKFAYEQATFVSSISPEMCMIIRGKGIPAEKIKLLPNWVGSFPESSLPSPGSWKMKHQIASDKVIVSYAGNLGVKQGLNLIMEVAKLLQHEPSIIFVIAGNGGAESNLKQLKDDYGLKNVLFEDLLPENEHTALILDSELCLIPQRKGASLHFLPSKLLKILALGRAIVTNPEQGSALYNSVVQGKFGLLVAAGDAQAMANAVLELVHNPEQGKGYGQAGKHYAEQFSKTDVLTSLSVVLEKMLK
jgi:colanic acid biosynthesis glycosyl transferase WcaI